MRFSRGSEIVVAILVPNKCIYFFNVVNHVSFQISMIQSKKRTEVLEALLGFVDAYSQHFHEGKSYFEDLDVFTQQLGIEIDGMKNKTDTLDKQLEKRHGYVSGTQ